jgi:hypothetical protein
MKNRKVKENYNNSDISDNQRSGNVNWWINELDSLGINKNSSNNEKNNNKSENYN